MKRLISAFTIILILLTFSSCARKSTPALTIKHESVTAIEFRRTVFAADDPLTAGKNFQKKVTEKEDVEKLICWLEELDLEKHEAIEVPIEKVSHVIILKGKKDHKLVFMNEFVVFDSTAYIYKDVEQMSQVGEKYNLLNYPETEVSSLGVI